MLRLCIAAFCCWSTGMVYSIFCCTKFSRRPEKSSDKHDVKNA
ncbi:hypothetical protein Pvag_1442 [Pantoea vagans C9-1]|nr:hypothetical protein Pvag_1442 [Pantoea vagans C9-1]